MKTLIVGACVLGFVACAHTGTAATPQQALLDWHNRYPVAAQDLCLVEGAHSVAANRLLDWERNNPVQAQEILEWAATHPGEPLPAFLRDHPSIRVDESFWGNSAVRLLLDWASRHPDAALALAYDPDVLKWSAEHHVC